MMEVAARHPILGKLVPFDLTKTLAFRMIIQSTTGMNVAPE
jgi:hypothetical protein